MTGPEGTEDSEARRLATKAEFFAQLDEGLRLALDQGSPENRDFALLRHRLTTEMFQADTGAKLNDWLSGLLGVLAVGIACQRFTAEQLVQGLAVAVHEEAEIRKVIGLGPNEAPFPMADLAPQTNPREIVLQHAAMRAQELHLGGMEASAAVEQALAEFGLKASPAEVEGKGDDNRHQH